MSLGTSEKYFLKAKEIMLQGCVSRLFNCEQFCKYHCQVWFVPIPGLKCAECGSQHRSILLIQRNVHQL